jgi:hypothetical protein
MRNLLILMTFSLLCIAAWAAGCAKVEQMPADQTSHGQYALPFSSLTDTLTAEQEHVVDTARQQLPELSTIGKHAPLEIGYSEDVFIQTVPDGWRVIFYSGWGDCPSGCINGRWHYVSVNKAGLATIVGRFKHEYDGNTNKYVDSGVAVWGMPK